MNTTTTLNLVLRCTQPDNFRRQQDLAKVATQAMEHHEAAENSAVIMRSRGDADSRELAIYLDEVAEGWHDLAFWAEKKADEARREGIR